MTGKPLRPRGTPAGVWPGIDYEKIRGTSVWVATDIIAALDDFGDRAGRRNG